MKNLTLKRAAIAAALMTAFAAPWAAAQTNTTTPSGSMGYQSSDPWERGRASSPSWIPYTSYGYFGVNLGRPEYDVGCTAGFSCENPNLAGKFYTGGLFSRALGMEIGYINLGDAERNGGETFAHGVNVSLVGNLPISNTFNIFAKAGTTYSWTEVTAAPGSGVLTGDNDDFGLSYGAGLGFDVSRDIQLVAEWDRNRVKFISGRENVDLYTLGVRFRF